MIKVSPIQHQPQFAGVRITDTLDIDNKQGNVTFTVVPNSFQTGVTYNGQTVPSTSADRLADTFNSREGAIGLLEGPHTQVGLLVTNVLNDSTVPAERKPQLAGAISRLHQSGNNNYAYGNFWTVDGENRIAGDRPANAFMARQIIYHGNRLQ